MGTATVWAEQPGRLFPPPPPPRASVSPLSNVTAGGCLVRAQHWGGPPKGVPFHPSHSTLPHPLRGPWEGVLQPLSPPHQWPPSAAATLGGGCRGQGGDPGVSSTPKVSTSCGLLQQLGLDEATGGQQGAAHGEQMELAG